MKKGNKSIICITFVNDKSVCYKSDRDGNLSDSDQFRFRQTTKNGVHIYTSIIKERVENRQRNQNQIGMFGYIDPNAIQNGYEQGFYTGYTLVGFPNYKFSNDFSKLNIMYTQGKQQKPTEVYVRVSEPTEQIDDSMY